MSLTSQPSLPEDDDQAIAQLVDNLSRLPPDAHVEDPPSDKTVAELINDLRNKTPVGLAYLAARRRYIAWSRTML